MESRRAEACARLTGLTLTRVLQLLAGATLTAADVGTAVWAGCVEPWAVDHLARGTARLADLVHHGCRVGGGPARLASCHLARALHDTR
jgi:hypothetical protein